MFRFVDHTAELEVELEADSPEGVLAEALRAFAELVGTGDGDALERTVSVGARDLPALLAIVGVDDRVGDGLGHGEGDGLGHLVRSARGGCELHGPAPQLTDGGALGGQNPGSAWHD